MFNVASFIRDGDGWAIGGAVRIRSSTGAKTTTRSIQDPYSVCNWCYECLYLSYVYRCMGGKSHAAPPLF
jgi:hypothetical protein